MTQVLLVTYELADGKQAANWVCFGDQMHPDPGSTTVSVCENAKRSSYLTEKDMIYSRNRCERPRSGKRDSAFPRAVVQGEQFCNILVKTE